MAGGAGAAGIIAFTFAETAAGELKARISARAGKRLGSGSPGRLGAAFVRTIHSRGLTCPEPGLVTLNGAPLG